MNCELPLVSVIIPTYNRVAFVMDAIESAKKQTYLNLEIIVVDDGSVDGTKDLLCSFSGIKYIYKDNGGQASARNAGLSVANGEIIASLDSDDIWDEDFLDILVQKILKEDLDFVFAHLKRISTNIDEPFHIGEYNFHIRKFLNRVNNGWVDLSKEEARCLYINTCPSPSTSFLITRKALGDGWNEKMKVGDDWFMQLSVILSGYSKCAYYVKPLWLKRVNDINVYDERDVKELCLDLHIHDINIFINEFRSKISIDECNVLKRFTVDGYIGLAILSAKSNNAYKEAFLYLWECIRKECLITCKAILQLTYNLVQNKLKLLMGR